MPKDQQIIMCWLRSFESPASSVVIQVILCGAFVIVDLCVSSLQWPTLQSGGCMFRSRRLRAYVMKTAAPPRQVGVHFGPHNGAHFKNLASIPGTSWRYLRTVTRFLFKRLASQVIELTNAHPHVHVYQEYPLGQMLVFLWLGTRLW